MKTIFDPVALEQFCKWGLEDKKVFKKIHELIKSIEREGFNKGLGKPEPMRYSFSGCWSRRITSEHRLVYQVTADTIFIFSCYGHYD